jgi:hypothetical protein
MNEEMTVRQENDYDEQNTSTLPEQTISSLLFVWFKMLNLLFFWSFIGF